MTDALQLRGLKMSHARQGRADRRATSPRRHHWRAARGPFGEAKPPTRTRRILDGRASRGCLGGGGEGGDDGGVRGGGGRVRFYKSWDRNGALSNFSPHPVRMPRTWGEGGEKASWPTVEHFYQAQKFSGVDNPVAKDGMERIRAAGAPEDAARIGRTLQRTRPELIRPDWDEVKMEVMRAAIRAKVDAHPAAAIAVGSLETRDAHGGLAVRRRLGRGAGRVWGQSAGENADGDSGGDERRRRFIGTKREPRYERMSYGPTADV